MRHVAVSLLFLFLVTVDQPSSSAEGPIVSDLVIRDISTAELAMLELSWEPVDLPEDDFSFYDVHRSDGNFTNSSCAPVILRVMDRTLTRVPISVEFNRDNWFAVTVRLTNGTENRNVTATGPVRAFPPIPEDEEKDRFPYLGSPVQLPLGAILVVVGLILVLGALVLKRKYSAPEFPPIPDELREREAGR